MQKVPRRGVIPHATVIPIVLTVLHSGTKYTANKLLTGADRSMRNIYKDLASEREIERETARERERERGQLRATTRRSHALSLSFSLWAPKYTHQKNAFSCCAAAGMKISAHDFPYTRSVFLWQRAESHTLAKRDATWKTTTWKSGKLRRQCVVYHDDGCVFAKFKNKTRDRVGE